MIADGITADGSTRAVSLIRIGVAVVALSEWGDALALPNAHDAWRMGVGTAYLLACVWLLAGWRSQLAALVLGAAMLVVLGTLDKSFRHHHTHLMALTTLLLAVTPCGGSYSVDRWLAVRRGTAPPERGALWGQRLIALGVSSVYLWSVFDKLNPAFLSGARMEHLWIHLYAADLPSSPLFHAGAITLSLATIATEIFLGIGLWFRRTRRPAIAAGIAFHLVIYLTLPVSTFSAMVILLYLAYLDPDDVHRFLDRIQQPAPPEETRKPEDEARGP